MSTTWLPKALSNIVFFGNGMWRSAVTRALMMIAALAVSCLLLLSLAMTSTVVEGPKAAGAVPAAHQPTQPPAPVARERFHVHFVAIGDEVTGGVYRPQMFAKATEAAPYHAMLAPFVVNASAVRAAAVRQHEAGDGHGGAHHDHDGLADLLHDAGLSAPTHPDVHALTTMVVEVPSATSHTLFTELHEQHMPYPDAPPLETLPPPPPPVHPNGAQVYRPRSGPQDPSEGRPARRQAPLRDHMGGWRSVRTTLTRLFAERSAEASRFSLEHWSQRRRGQSAVFDYPFAYRDAVVVLCGVMVGPHDALTASASNPQQRGHAAMSPVDTTEYVVRAHEQCLGYFHHRIAAWIEDEVIHWDTSFAVPPLEALQLGAAVHNVSKAQTKQLQNKKRRRGARQPPQLGLRVHVVAVPMAPPGLQLDPDSAVFLQRVMPVLQSSRNARNVDYCVHRDPNNQHHLQGAVWPAVQAHADTAAADIASGVVAQRVEGRIAARGWRRSPQAAAANATATETASTSSSVPTLGLTFLHQPVLISVADPSWMPDLRKLFASSDPARPDKVWLWSDCLHLTAAGYRALAAAVGIGIRRIVAGIATAG